MNLSLVNISKTCIFNLCFTSEHKIYYHYLTISLPNQEEIPNTSSKRTHMFLDLLSLAIDTILYNTTCIYFILAVFTVVWLVLAVLWCPRPQERWRIQTTCYAVLPELASLYRQEKKTSAIAELGTYNEKPECYWKHHRLSKQKHLVWTSV